MYTRTTSTPVFPTHNLREFNLWYLDTILSLSFEAITLDLIRDKRGADSHSASFGGKLQGIGNNIPEYLMRIQIYISIR
jgi:hypothetical protein